MITSQQNGLKPSCRSQKFMYAIVSLVLLGIAGLAVVMYGQSFGVALGMASAMEITTSPNDNLYLVVRAGDNSGDRIVELDQKTGKVKQSFTTGYNTAVKLTANKQIVYVFREPLDRAAEGKGSLSAIDSRTGKALWQIKLPGWPFVASPSEGAWLSTDESRLYLLATPDGFKPHIFVVETQTRKLVRDVEISLPHPVFEFFPRIWKAPQSEALFIISRDQLFTYDLVSGEASSAVDLVDPASRGRIPQNFSKGFYIQDGVIDAEARELLLATASQEIVSVKLDTTPFTVKRLASLPEGWLFGGSHLLTVSPKEKTVYVTVKRANTPILNGIEAEEVWVFDRADGAWRARLSLREGIANFTNRPAANVNLTNYGLFLSPNQRNVYVLAPNGLVHLSRDRSGSLNTSWVNIDNPLLDIVFAASVP